MVDGRGTLDRAVFELGLHRCKEHIISAYFQRASLSAYRDSLFSFGVHPILLCCATLESMVTGIIHHTHIGCYQEAIRLLEYIHSNVPLLLDMEKLYVHLLVDIKTKAVLYELFQEQVLTDECTEKVLCKYFGPASDQEMTIECSTVDDFCKSLHVYARNGVVSMMTSDENRRNFQSTHLFNSSSVTDDILTSLRTYLSAVRSQLPPPFLGKLLEQVYHTHGDDSSSTTAAADMKKNLREFTIAIPKLECVTIISEDCEGRNKPTQEDQSITASHELAGKEVNTTSSEESSSTASTVGSFKSQVCPSKSVKADKRAPITTRQELQQKYNLRKREFGVDMTSSVRTSKLDTESSDEDVQTSELDTNSSDEDVAGRMRRGRGKQVMQQRQEDLRRWKRRKVWNSDESGSESADFRQESKQKVRVHFGSPHEDESHKSQKQATNVSSVHLKPDSFVTSPRSSRVHSSKYRSRDVVGKYSAKQIQVKRNSAPRSKAKLSSPIFHRSTKSSATVDVSSEVSGEIAAKSVTKGVDDTDLNSLPTHYHLRSQKSSQAPYPLSVSPSKKNKYTSRRKRKQPLSSNSCVSDSHQSSESDVAHYMRITRSKAAQHIRSEDTNVAIVCRGVETASMLDGVNGDNLTKMDLENSRIGLADKKLLGSSLHPAKHRKLHNSRGKGKASTWSSNLHDTQPSESSVSDELSSEISFNNESCSAMQTISEEENASKSMHRVSYRHHRRKQETPLRRTSRPDLKMEAVVLFGAGEGAGGHSSERSSSDARPAPSRPSHHASTSTNLVRGAIDLAGGHVEQSQAASQWDYVAIETVAAREGSSSVVISDSTAGDSPVKCGAPLTSLRKTRHPPNVT